MEHRFRIALLAAVVGCSAAPMGGCGASDDGKTIEVDEVKEKALTDSMRGYYEKEKSE